jgi:hypothetical protein
LSKLNKTASGLLLYEDFKENSLIWTPSPNNYMNIGFSEAGLQIKHSDTYKTFTIQEPQEDYCFICKLNHVPINEDDIGGVIVMSNDTSYLECQSYIANKHSYVTNEDVEKQQILELLDEILEGFVEYSITDDSGTYPSINPSTNIPSNMPIPGGVSESTNETFEDVMYAYIKVIKKNTVYSFFASTDGEQWIEVGNSKFNDTHRIGFFLHSMGTFTPDDLLKSNFYVEYAMFYDNNYVIIRNVKDVVHTLELRDENGALICDNHQTSSLMVIKDNTAYIDTTLLKMPYDNLRLVMLNSSNNILFDYTIKQLVGGDRYEYGYDLKVCIDNTEIDQEELFKLDAFKSNEQTVRIDIYNQEQFEITNLKVSIAQYSVYYNGCETIGISLYDENEEVYDFKESVVIDSIMPTEGRSVLIKLTDRTVQDFYKKEGAYRFKLNIE